MNLAPRLSTCSLAAGRTSVAVTTAPSRRAVAIACRPATPAPMTNSLAERAGPAYLEHHVGVLDGVLDDCCAGGGVFSVRKTGLDAGARLHDDLGAERYHLPDGFRGRGDPVFGGISLTRDCYAHHPVSLGTWRCRAGKASTVGGVAEGKQRDHH